MKIGELAAATDTPVETIRFYERVGLLPEPARTGANYRAYDPSHTQRLAFIRRCRSLDMALDEVRVLLRFQDQPTEDCRDVNTVLDEHIGHVAQRVRELQVLEKQLRALRARCGSAQSGRACGILALLNADPDGSGLRSRQLSSGQLHVGLAHGRLGNSKKA